MLCYSWFCSLWWWVAGGGALKATQSPTFIISPWLDFMPSWVITWIWKVRSDPTWQQTTDSWPLTQIASLGIIEVLCASQEFMDKIKWTPADAVLVPALLTRIKNEIEATSGEKFEKNKKVHRVMPNTWLHTRQWMLHACLCCSSSMLPIAQKHSVYWWPICIDFQWTQHYEKVCLDRTKRIAAWHTACDCSIDQLYVIEKSFHLISGMFQIALARDWTLTTFSTIHLGQMIVQGVYDHSLPLLQLPGMTNEILKSFKSQKVSRTVL